MINDLKYASLVIPKIIVDANDTINRNANIVKYKVSIKFNKSFLFYRELFDNPNVWLQYDRFNFIPLTYDEIVMYVYYSNQFDTLLTGKVINKINKLMYIP